jgi:hypothetical protein
VTTKTRVTISLIAYLLLGLGIIALVYARTIEQGKTWDEFSKAAGIGVTLLTSLLAGVISLIVAKSQQQAALNLEQSKGAIAKEVNRENETFKGALTEKLSAHNENLKATLALEVGKKIEEIRQDFGRELEMLRNTLAREMARETETLKNNLATNLEFLKTRFGLERESFRLLSQAAYHYYHALAELERGTFDQNGVKEAEAMMVDASSYISHLLEDQPKDVWYELWQLARTISEQAQRDASDKSALELLWNRQGPMLGLRISEFEDIASSAYRGLPSNALTGPPAAGGTPPR